MATGPNSDLSAKRYAFLRAMSEAANGDPGVLVPIPTIATQLGFETALANRIADYLHRNGLIELVMGNKAFLTNEGLDEIEHPTRPAVAQTDNINIGGDVTNSPIVQGSPGAFQHHQIDTEILRALAVSIRAALETAPLVDLEMTEAMADLKVLETQVDSPAPRAEIIRLSLESLRALLAVAAAAPEVSRVVDEIMHALGSL